MAIWYGKRFASWKTKASDTHWEYVTQTAFPRLQWLRERASMVRYTYIACIVDLCVLHWNANRSDKRCTEENNLVFRTQKASYSCTKKASYSCTQKASYSCTQKASYSCTQRASYSCTQKASYSCTQRASYSCTLVKWNKTNCFIRWALILC
jgi:hypothetical protein